MNTRDNGNSDDRLQEDLDQIARSYGQLEHMEPPDMVDQAILNSAHRATEKKQHWMNFGWIQGLTTTALIVLAVTVVLKQSETIPLLEDNTNINGDIPLLQADEPTPVRSPDKRDVDTAMLKKQIQEESGVVVQDMAAAPPAAAEMATRNSEYRVSSKRSLDDVLTRTEADEAGATPGKSTARQRSDAQAAAAEAVTPATEKPADAHIDIEQQLQVILGLKEADDETWITELEKFTRKYPDYPLPEELKSK